MRPPRHIIVVDTWGATQDVSAAATVLRLGGGSAWQCELRGSSYTRWSSIDFTTAEQWWQWLYERCLDGRHYWLFGLRVARSWSLLGGWGEIDAGMLSWLPGRPSATDTGGSIGLIDGDPPTYMRLRGKAGWGLSVADVRNYVDADLDAMAADVCIARDTSSPAADTRNAVQVVAALMSTIIEEYGAADLGAWRPTLGGLAMSAWRSRYVQRAPLVHCHRDTETMERMSLYGGEFRAYRRGAVTGPVHMLDVNMLYPWAASEGTLPVELAAPMHATDIGAIQEWRRRLIMCADVSVESPHELYARRTETGVRWCRGRLRTTLIGDDLLAAVDYGHVVRVHGVSAYLPGHPMAEFMRACHAARMNLRSDDRPVEAALYKGLANALVGKFGQRQGSWEWVPRTAPGPAWGQWSEVDAQLHGVTTYRGLGRHAQVKVVGGEGVDSVPALTAAIHARARQRMREMIRVAGYDEVVYQAADCLHVTDVGLRALSSYVEETPGQLGMLRHQGTAMECYYRGANDYTADGIMVRAGMPAGAVETSPGVWSYEETQGMRETLAVGALGAVVVTRTRTWHAAHAARDAYDDDGRIIPDTVCEW